MTYVLKRCKNVADLKAVSQNMMHSSLQVTDSIYGVLSHDAIETRISAPSKQGKEMQTAEEGLLAQLEHLKSTLDEPSKNAGSDLVRA